MKVFHHHRTASNPTTAPSSQRWKMATDGKEAEAAVTAVQGSCNGSGNQTINSTEAPPGASLPAPTAPAQATPPPVSEPPAPTPTKRDLYSLQVKPEFVLETRAASLPPIVENGDAISNSGRDSGGAGRENNRKPGKRNRGRNKKRPRDVNITDDNKICLSILRGQECSYGADKCRFSHDLKAYLATRPPDIKIKGFLETCPIYERSGYCHFGCMCRFGDGHTNPATGTNLGERKPGEEHPAVMNNISTDLRMQLRKNTYPFVCPRHFQKKKKNHGKNDESETTDKIAEARSGNVEAKAGESAYATANSSDFSPLPTKTRKIIDFSNKVYVAPLTTVGNLPFRRVMKKCGADITCGEMAVATHLLEGKPSEWALLKRHSEEDIFGIQLAAGYADIFTRTMEVVEKHVEVDFVDINLGCPIDLICEKGAGSALMMREKRLKDSLIGMTKALQKCPVTIKMRTGWDEKKPFAHELVPKIQSWGIPGIATVMIHGRSRLQRYSREADWDYIVNRVATSQNKNLPEIPIVGNGDIFTYIDYEEKVEKNDCIVNCAMLARGALIKPWLPTEIKEKRHWDISASERFDLLKDFVRFGLEHWGTDQQGVNNCRRFLLEWLSFLHRYVPVGLLEQTKPQSMNQRPPKFFCGRNDLETLLLSDHCSDWIKISEMLLGPVPDGFRFEPKHKANSYNVDSR